MSNQNQKKIWVMNVMYEGDTEAVYTNADKDLEIEAMVIDVDVMYDDNELDALARQTLRTLQDEGKLRNIYTRPYWAVLDKKTGLCTNRFPEGAYEFVQAIPFDDGGFGIATTGDYPIVLKSFTLSERQDKVTQAGWDMDHDERLDSELDNVYAAQCIFETTLEAYLLPDLCFDTMEQALQHIADQYVDCFLFPEVLSKQTVRHNVNGLPTSIDIEQAVHSFDKETLADVAFCFAAELVKRIDTQPQTTDFTLEMFLAETTMEDIHRMAAREKPNRKTWAFILGQYDRAMLISLLLSYNRYIRSMYLRGVEAGCVYNLDDFVISPWSRTGL